MKVLEMLGVVYQDSIKNLNTCFDKARQAPAGSAGDILKILYDNVRQLGDVARTVNAVRELENYGKARDVTPVPPLPDA
jgi:hypothetical protein